MPAPDDPEGARSVIQVSEPVRAPEARNDTSTQATVGGDPAHLTAEQSNSDIHWQVVSGGGTTSHRGSYVLSGSAGQTAVSSGSRATNVVHHGFWQAFNITNLPCCGRYNQGFTGNTDCSDDGKLNLVDITRLIDRVYLSKTPLCCEENGNTDGDSEGRLNLSDITKLIDFVYLSHSPTAPCE